jgi:hypothetical protein
MRAEAADAFDAEVRHALEDLTAEGAIATRDSRSLSLQALWIGVTPAAENHDAVLDRSTNSVGLDAGVPLQLGLNVVPNLFVSARCFGCDHLSTMRQGL